MLTKEQIENPPYVAAKYWRKGRIKKVELIVIHTMEAPEKGLTAEAVAKYFQNTGVMASAHYCIDNNSVVQCVYDSDTAFACKNANANGVHLEHAGYAKQSEEDWMDEFSKEMLGASAQLAAYLAKKFDIPVKRAKFASDTDPRVVEPGFCGHADVPLHGSHWDPGKSFPWDYYFGLVEGYMAEQARAEGGAAGDTSGEGKKATEDPVQNT